MKMKCSIPTVSAVIICIAGCITALKFMESIEYIVREKYGLTMQQLKEKCDKRGSNLYGDVSKMQERSGGIINKLAHEIAEIAKKKPKVTDEDWNRWIKEKCVSRQDLKDISKKAIDKVQSCMHPKDRLAEASKLKAQRDLNSRFCWAVKALAKHEYQSRHLGSS